MRGMLSEMFNPTPRAMAQADAWDDRWYQPLFSLATDGTALTADTIFNCGTVLAAVTFRADCFAMCPPQVIKELPGNRREQDRDHYLHKVLRNPNTWMSAYRWKHQNEVWVSTWGNSYNRIIGGRQAFVEQLWPLHPSRVRVAAQLSDGSLIYKYRSRFGMEETLGQDEILHFRGLSLDGFSGLPIYQVIRNAVSIALLAERHVSSFLKKGSRLSGLLVPQLKLDKDQRKDLRDSWTEAFGGPDSTGTMGVVPYNVKFEPMAVDNQKGQVLEFRDQQVGDILRFLKVPGVMVGYGEKTATYASADAFFEKGGIKHCVQPIITNYEDEIAFALVEDGDPHTVKFNLDVLTRANIEARYNSIYKATGRPWMTGNEGRSVEDLNPNPDPSMDKVLMPANMTTGTDDPSQFIVNPGPTPDDTPDDGGPSKPPNDKGSGQFVRDAAARVVRREVAAITGTSWSGKAETTAGKGKADGRTAPSVKYAKDPAAFAAWAQEFYAKDGKHVRLVMDTMHVPQAIAAEYAAGQCAELLADGMAAVERWEETVVPRLVELAELEDQC